MIDISDEERRVGLTLEQQTVISTADTLSLTGQGFDSDLVMNPREPGQIFKGEKQCEFSLTISQMAPYSQEHLYQRHVVAPQQHAVSERNFR